MELNSISVLTVLTIVFGVTTSCFITNCPPGGKRSFLSNNIEVQHKQCTKCGPDNSGRCFGPDICCGDEIGCHLRNSWTKVCKTENLILRPCKNDGKVCDHGKGICAIDSLCCSSYGCFIDKTCQREEVKSSFNAFEELIK